MLAAPGRAASHPQSTSPHAHMCRSATLDNAPRAGDLGHANLWGMPDEPGSSGSQFLVVDDYGTGGIWFMIQASSEAQIRAALPTVRIYPPGSRPEWMSDEALSEIAIRRTYDLDSLPTSDWMNRLRERRS